jgi:hypothetical protein
VCGVAEAGEGDQRTPERSARGTLAVTGDLVDHEFVKEGIIG